MRTTTVMKVKRKKRKETAAGFHKLTSIEKLVPYGLESRLEKFEVIYKQKIFGVVRKVNSLLVQSLLNDEKVESATLNNFNESSPSLHVVNILLDVLACCPRDVLFQYGS